MSRLLYISNFILPVTILIDILSVNKFKLSTTLGGSAISIGGNSTASNDNFSFVRNDAVYQQNLINYIEPEYQDSGNEGDDFSFLEGSNINTSFESAQTNTENAEFFTGKKYRGDQQVSVSDEIKSEIPSAFSKSIFPF